MQKLKFIKIKDVCIIFFSILAFIIAPEASILAQETPLESEAKQIPDLTKIAPKGLFDSFKNKSSLNASEKTQKEVLKEIGQGIDIVGPAIQKKIERYIKQSLLANFKNKSQGAKERITIFIKNINLKIKDFFLEEYKKLFKGHPTY